MSEFTDGGRIVPGWLDKQIKDAHDSQPHVMKAKIAALEARVRELEAERNRLREAIERAPCHDFCREAKARHYIPYSEHHHACWKVGALKLEGQDYMRPALKGEG